jgi:hypothetical protein
MVQFIANRSLWFDEAMLAFNIIHKPFAELFKPLDLNQVAPVLFLIIEKIFAMLWNNSEYGLRLFPLISYAVAALVFYKIITQHLTNIHAKIVAAAIFAFGYVIIYYSSEVKQYMTDGMVTLIMFWITTKHYKTEKRKYVTAGLAGTVAIFLSNVAPIVLLTCGICALYEQIHVKHTKNIGPLIGVATLWVTAFLVCYFAIIHNHPARQFMIACWKTTFLPANPFHSDFYLFLFKQAPVTLFASLFGLDVLKPRTIIVVITMAALFAVGIAKLIRNKQIALVLFICLPVLLHLSLSALQLYPFDRRLILYTLPGVAIGCAVGFGCGLKYILDKLHLTRLQPVATAAVALAIIASLIVRIPVPGADYRGCIQFMNDNANEDHSVYPFSEAVCSFRYYSELGIVKHNMHVMGKEDWVNINSWSWTLGGDRRGQYIKDVAATAKGKTWLLLRGSDWDHLVSLLETQHGFVILKKFKPQGVSLYLVEPGKTTFND